MPRWHIFPRRSTARPPDFPPSACHDGIRLALLPPGVVSILIATMSYKRCRQRRYARYEAGHQNCGRRTTAQGTQLVAAPRHGRLLVLRPIAADDEYAAREIRPGYSAAQSASSRKSVSLRRYRFLAHNAVVLRRPWKARTITFHTQFSTNSQYGARPSTG